MPKKTPQILIVGQGLAGTLAANQLLKLGFDFLLVDQGFYQSASWTAGGFLIPITGPRLVLTPNYQHSLDVAQKVYGELSKTLKLPGPALTPIAYTRTVQTPSEESYLSKRLKDPLYSPYIEAITPNSFSLHHVYHLDNQTLLARFRHSLLRLKKMVVTSFNHQELKIVSKGVEWRGAFFDAILFCEGAGLKKNPFFQHLPYHCSKGEIITVELNQKHQLTNMVAATNWCYPLTNTKVKIGATHQWHQWDLKTTEEARRKLWLSSIPFLPPDTLPLRFSQRAGLRLSSQKGNPFIETHPQYPQLMVCAGFGSKGFLYLPDLISTLFLRMLHRSFIF